MKGTALSSSNKKYSLKSKKPHLKRGGAFLNNFGGDLLSHTVAHAVSSAQ
jgi:hypothetical protein